MISCFRGFFERAMLLLLNFWVRFGFSNINSSHVHILLDVSYYDILFIISWHSGFPMERQVVIFMVEKKLVSFFFRSCFVLVGDLHNANKISSDLGEEISIIKAKYLKCGHPNGFIDSAINNFHQTKEDFIIAPTLFEEREEISFQVPFSKTNEEKMKRIICNLEECTNYKIKFSYSWKTRKL